MDTTYYRKGFGLKKEIQGKLEADYHSAVVDTIKASDYSLQVGHVTFRLAREFGFCYGVDRAVEYAYETRRKFPDRRLFLVGEIIHNPHVNKKMEDMGIAFLSRGADGAFDFAGVTEDDVVILPAFGVTIHDFKTLRDVGCVLVDTTCGSVLNVWKRVERYARDGFTAIIHGKHYHEETKATASQVMKHPGGKYLIVLNMDEARMVCDFIEGSGDHKSLERHFSEAVSPGFTFEHDLTSVGLANQTTMLSGESLAIAEEFRKSLVRRFGEDDVDRHFRTFDTICSATQERQDAIMAMLESPPDVMVVVGGFNSSNTHHLASLCVSRGVRTYHIADASCIDLETGVLLHQDVAGKKQVEETDWLQDAREIGITAGASTPNNKIGETVARICTVAGLDLSEAVSAGT
jgi:4-hydroxy-3-methylbut-2-enyl diphosphate reductase